MAPDKALGGGGSRIPKLHRRRGATLVLHGFWGGGTSASVGGRGGARAAPDKVGGAHFP
jgi:hypothetical protein